MNASEELTQPKYSEQWVVVVDKREYVLNEDEIKILKEADKSGHRGIIWFDKYAISVPHISSIYLNDRRIKFQLDEGEKWSDESNPEKVEEIKEKIRDKIKTF